MLKLKEPVTPGARLVLSVYDELVLEVSEAEVDEAKRGIRDAMQSVNALDVLLLVEVGHRKTWNEAH